MRFLLRDEQFFNLFIRHARLTTEAASLLHSALASGSTRLRTAAIRVEQIEQEGDEIVHDLLLRLNQTFFTPLDPEDIHALASRLDDVLDGIEECAYRISAYRLKTIPDDVVELCQIVLSASQVVQDAMERLAHDQDLGPACIEINRLEDVADELVRTNIDNLLTGEGDVLERMKLKEIYEFFEATTNRCKDVADVLQNVLVKNG